MTKDEALKMALETFEEIYDGCGHVIEDHISKSTIALAEYVRKDCVKGMDAIKEVLAQPEQKPVTLQINGIPPFKNPPNDVIDAAFHVSDWAQRNNWTKWRIGNCCSCDYTTPPKRKWVWLTRMDLIKCGVLPFGMSYELCQAIESKLREKNGY